MEKCGSELTVYNELKKLSQSANHMLKECNSLTIDKVNVLSSSLDKITIDINLKEPKGTNSVNENYDEEIGDDDDDSDDSDEEEEHDNESDGTSLTLITSKSSSDNEMTHNSRKNSKTDDRVNHRSLRRTNSESSNTRIRGILKYPRNWHRRTVSESNCDTNGSGACNLDDYGNSLSYEIVDEESGNEENDAEHYINKSKKSVRFNDRVSKAIFRANSCILGRRNKNQKRNQKRAKNRKNAKNRNLQENNGTNDSVQKSENSKIIDESVHLRLRQDSGYDSEGKEDTLEHALEKLNARDSHAQIIM